MAAAGGLLAGLLVGPQQSSASAAPAAPPQTLAAARRVVPDQTVESSFPIDFLGVLYNGDAHGATARFRSDGRWGPWIDLEEDGVEVAGRWASGLVSGSDASAYQVRVPGGARSARAVVINTTDGPEQEAAVSAAAPCPDVPTIVTRCEWGADESLMTWTPEFFPTQKLTVHHTATRNNDADPAATVRAIYRYQAVDRGFGDIGYQYLIDEAGNTYEGRFSGNDAYPAHDGTGTKGVTAAHVGGFNSGNTGIALLGTLTEAAPTSSARGSLEQLLGELATRHAIDPHGSTEYVNPVNGVTKSVANISGHRDWAATECPGGALYALLPAIRDAATGSPPPPPPPPDPESDITAPEISDVTTTTKKTTVTFRWRTNEPATSQVEYTTKGQTTTSALDTNLTTTHSVTISRLARRTTYEYRVVSMDAAKNEAESALGFFTTP